MKIAIIGNAGSGKSTLSLKLHNITGLPVYHLDQYFWLPNWQEPDRTTFEKIHNQLCDRENWIIEGVATRFFAYRAQKADILIFLDTPRWLCLYRVIRRAIKHFGKEHAFSPKGCPEKGPDIKFLKFIWKFNTLRKPHIKQILQKHKGIKPTFLVKNKQELQQCIDAIKAM